MPSAVEFLLLWGGRGKRQRMSFSWPGPRGSRSFLFICAFYESSLQRSFTLVTQASDRRLNLEVSQRLNVSPFLPRTPGGVSAF